MPQPKKSEVKEIQKQLEVKIKRYEQALYTIKKDSLASGLKDLQADYAFFLGNEPASTEIVQLIKNHLNDKNNKQLANIIEYTGPDTPRLKSDLTLAMLYDPDNPGGIRDWHWEDFKFILGYFTEDFTKENSKNQGKRLKARKKALADKKELLKLD